MDSPSEIHLAGVTRSFGETVALDGVDLVIRTGEVLGVAGPNGAGKSTLVRIMAGEDQPDSGQIAADGSLLGATDLRKWVALVHQEPQIWPNLTVSENLMVGHERKMLGRQSLDESQRRVLGELGIASKSEWLVGDCTLAVRQRTEIARAIARDARLFLFDEPNSSLSEDESQALFKHIHSIADSGRMVVLVTHRLAEMVAHCDRVVVVRDGRVVCSLVGDGLTQASIARQLVVGSSHGHAGDSVRRSPNATRVPVLELTDWSAPNGEFRSVQFVIKHSEIIGVAGVEGSGAREFVRSTAAAFPARGNWTNGDAPTSEMVGAATAYLCPDRRSMLYANLSVGENLVIRLGKPDIATAGGLLRPKQLQRIAASLLSRFQIRSRSAQQPLPNLSGGNQQKVALAAAVASRPRLLVMEEPTRGVDVASKREIYDIVRRFAHEGGAVLMYCTEVPELFELAERVLVVEGGYVVADMQVSDFSDVAALAERVASAEHTAPKEQETAASSVHLGQRLP